MARLIAITYGGYVVGLGGTSSSVILTDKYRTSEGYTEFSVEFEAVVRNATRATFLAAEAALISAFTTPDQDLSIALGGTARQTYSHSGNTGFNARATCRKVGQSEDSANSARYACSVTVQLPADLSGRSGRRTSSVRVDAEPNGVRLITIEGEYTALSTNSATAQYIAAATTYCDAVVAAVGGTFELEAPIQAGSGLLAVPGFQYDDQNKVLSFRRVYREVIYRQSLSALDESAIRRPSIAIERVTPADDSDPSFSTRPLEPVSVTYSAVLDKNVKLGTEQLAAYYTSVIYPLMRAELELVAGTFVVMQHRGPVINPYSNTIEARVDAVADVGGGTFFRATLDAEDFIQHGLDFAPVWSGDPDEVDEYKRHRLWLKIVTRMTVCRQATAIEPYLNIPEYPGFKEVEQRRKETHGSFGVTGDQIPYKTVTHTFVFRKVKTSVVTGTDGGGGGFSSGGGDEGTKARDPETMKALGLKKYQ